MKKLKYLLAALSLAVCLTGTASAITPAYTPPKLPAVSKITVTVPSIKFPDSYFGSIVGNVKIPEGKLPNINISKEEIV